MMRIDLREIPSLVLTCPPETRRKHVTKQLARLGIRCTYIEGIQCTPKLTGCAIAHLKGLMAPGISPPFVAYEDDCSATKDFRPVIDVPDEADVLYLGVSTWGSLPEISPRGISRATIATRYSDDFLQVHNMLGGHAIVFLTPQFVEAAKQRTIEQLVQGRNFDQGMAALQRRFLALTPNRPMFYQDRSVGGQQTATRNPIQPTLGRVVIANQKNRFVAWVENSRLMVERAEPHPIQTSHIVVNHPEYARITDDSPQIHISATQLQGQSTER